MKTSEEGIKLICQFEGFSEKPYLCPAKIPTIGFGSTFYEDGRKVTMQDAPIKRDRAMKLMAAVLAKDFEPKVSKALKVGVTQWQFDAMMSLAYNIGTGAFLGSSVLKMVNIGSVDAAANAFLAWSKVRKGGVLVESAGLKARREKERLMFLGK